MPRPDAQTAEFVRTALDDFDEWFRQQKYVRNSRGHILERGHEFTDYVIRRRDIETVEHPPAETSTDALSDTRLILRPQLLIRSSDTFATRNDEMVVRVTNAGDVLVTDEYRLTEEAKKS